MSKSCNPSTSLRAVVDVISFPLLSFSSAFTLFLVPAPIEEMLCFERIIIQESTCGASQDRLYEYKW
jgi:hypothetical protein